MPLTSVVTQRLMGRAEGGFRQGGIACLPELETFGFEFHC